MTDPSARKTPPLEHSILIASRNEGAALQRTLSDLYCRAPKSAFEVLLVDDASDDGSFDFLKDEKYPQEALRVIRNETRRGVISSRAQAADLASGKYLVFLDAHSAFSEGWLEGLTAELRRIDDQGIVVPLLYGLKSEDWSIDRETAPGSASSIVNPFLDFNWVEPLILESHACTCIISGGAWMLSRDWYRQIGGLDRAMMFWGGENIDVALRTWLAGGWCVVAESVLVGHWFKESHIASADGVALVMNKIRAAHNVFGKETFHQIMLRLRCLKGFREALRRVEGDRQSLGRIKKHAESIRKRSDRWLMDTFRLPLLEPPFFYRSQRRSPNRIHHLHRPLVSVVLTCKEEAANLESLVTSVLQKTTYGNYELLIVSSAQDPSPLGAGIEKIYGNHPRVRVLRSWGSLGGGVAENLWTFASHAEYCAFLDEEAIVLDEHWIEKFILLFERRRGLFLASPRLCEVDSSGNPLEGRGEIFDAVWESGAPLFYRERVALPLAEVPYQALSCPRTCLFLRRERFVELGGFDPTVLDGERPVMDLALHGWLSGYEVFCHPGIRSGRRRILQNFTAPSREPCHRQWLEYARILPVVKYFTNAKRIKSCRQSSPLAEPLLQRHRCHIDKCRREFLSRSKFDEDWLFYKFKIEDAPHDESRTGGSS